MLLFLSVFAVFGKVSQPVPHKFEAFALYSVNAHPALLLVTEQTRSFEHPQVPGCCLPGVIEDCRNFAGSHGSTVEINREQYPSSGSVR
jgi:hypothetical protein